MDEKAAIAYLENARMILQSFLASPYRNAKLPTYREQFARMEGSLQEIVIAFGPELRDQVKLGGLNIRDVNPVLVEQAVVTIDQLLGNLENKAVVDEIIGPRGPQMSASRLHETVWSAAQKPWDSRNYRASVQAAASRLIENIKTKTNRYDVDGTDLINQVFSKDDPAPGKARLRWPGDPTHLDVKDMAEGLPNFARGVISTVRNASSHTSTEMDEQIALEHLAVLSVLARFIEACEVASTDSPGVLDTPK